MTGSPMPSWSAQEKLTLLLDAGRNSRVPFPGGWKANPGEDVFALAFCKHGCTRHLRSPVLAGGVSGFVHIARQPITPLPDRADGGGLVLLRAPRSDGAPRFQQGARQRLVDFHHLSLKAFRPWPQAALPGRMVEGIYPKSRGMCYGKGKAYQ